MGEEGAPGGVLARNAGEVVFEAVRSTCQQALDTLTEVRGDGARGGGGGGEEE